MMMTPEREKIETIIREISLIDIKDSYSREKNLGNIERLINLKQDLERIKPDSRLILNPSIKELSSKMKKLLIQKDFHDMQWQNPNKLLMAITPGFIFVCLIAPPAVFALLTLIYVL